MAQSTLLGQDTLRNPLRPILPFLLIPSSADKGGTGEAGIAMLPSASDDAWNPSKLPFSDQHAGVLLNYNPWLASLGLDLNLVHLFGFTQIGRGSALSGSVKFLDLGVTQLTGTNGNSTGTLRPSEFAASVAYAQKLSKKFSLGVQGKYIFSNLGGGFQSSQLLNLSTFTVGISAYYNTDISLGGYPGKILRWF